MDINDRRPEALQRHFLLYPKNHDVPPATGIVPEIMIEADFFYLASLQKFDGFARPEISSPASGSFTLTVQKDFHDT